MEVVGIENEKYENLKADFQSNIVNCGEKGDVAEALKNYAEDFALCWVYLASVNPDGTINAIGANNSEIRFEVISSFDYLQNENVRYDYMIEIKF